MEVKYLERCELISLIVDLRRGCAVEYMMHFTRLFNGLKIHQTHKQSVELTECELIEFINEVRVNEKNVT